MGLLQEGAEMPIVEGMASEEVVDNSVSIFELIAAGGFPMIILGALSIWAVYILVERVLYIQKARHAPDEMLDRVKAAVLDGDIKKAIGICQQEKTPMGIMLVKGLQRIGAPLKTIEVAIENAGKLEVYKLEKNLSILGTISGAAPMIGFFGTIMGMIKAFISIAQQEGAVSPKMLSEGIYEAMITTAGGLFVGIIAYVGYNFMVRMVSKVIHHMEVTSIEFIDLLQKPQ